jgi:tRNA1(Val) A37 N6-methylase TrmN6
MPDGQVSATPPTTVDTVLNGRLQLEQPVKGPRAGLDAIFLAQALPAPSGDVLDVGAGTGVVGLAVLQRCHNAMLTAIEIDAGLSALIGRNARANGLERRVRVITGDVTAPLQQLGIEPGSQDVILCNPPYATTGAARVADNPVRERAHTMPAGGLERWARCWAALARGGSRLVLVHRADRIGAILAALDGRFGAVEVMPLFPRQGVAAQRILVCGIKGSRALPMLYPGLVLHNADGAWTAEANAVLTGDATLWQV